MLVCAHFSLVPKQAPISSTVNCSNLMSAVPLRVARHSTLWWAKPKKAQHSRFKMCKWGEGWGSTNPLLNRDHRSHRRMARNVSKWCDEIRLGDAWNTAQRGIIHTYVSTTDCSPFSSMMKPKDSHHYKYNFNTTWFLYIQCFPSIHYLIATA